MLKVLVLVVLTVAVVSSVPAEPSNHPLVVTTINGFVRGEKLSGVAFGNYSSFEGIPYDKAPVGDLRFRAQLPDNLMPITKIPNTNLFAGIFYKLLLKSLPKGLVTWANKGNYYVQYELSPTELPKYEIGGPFGLDQQWVFGATESSVGYTLTNRGIPRGYLIWVHAKAGSGNHVAVYDDPQSRLWMSQGGKWRNDALWIFQPTEEKHYYKIENFAVRNNFLTWTSQKHNDFNFYMQLAQDYNEDSKFSIQPVGIKLDANIYDFQFSRNLESFLCDNESDYRQDFRQSTSNFGETQIVSTLETTIQIKDSLTISFNESMALMNKAILSISMLESIGLPVFSFQGGFKANVNQQTEILKTPSIKKQIVVPARKTVEAEIFTAWAKNVELPFSAKMRIVGRTDRMVRGNPSVTREGSVPLEFVEQFINSSQDEKFEVISRSDDYTVRVSGVLKGNFAIKSVLRTRVTDCVQCNSLGNSKHG